MQSVIFRTAAAFGLIFAAASAKAQQHKPFGYLIEAANEMARIEYSHAVVSAEDNARITRIACDALTRSTRDNDLLLAADTVLFHKLSIDRGAAAALAENLDQFNAVFLPAEAELMRAQGLDYPAIVDALHIASKTRPNSSVKDLTPASIFSNVNRAQSQVCRFAESAVSERQRAQTRWTYGGILIMGADLAGALAIIMGTTGTGTPALPVVLTSVALGSTAAVAGATGNIP